MLIAPAYGAGRGGQTEGEIALTLEEIDRYRVWDNPDEDGVGDGTRNDVGSVELPESLGSGQRK